MGVEPTVAVYLTPTDGFEDRGAHRGPTTPTSHFNYIPIAHQKQIKNFTVKLANLTSTQPVGIIISE